MRKVLITIFSILLAVGIILFGLYHFYKQSVTESIINKNDDVNLTWEEVIKAKKELNEQILQFLKHSLPDTSHSGSLMSLVEQDNLNLHHIHFCDSSFIYQQYNYNTNFFFPAKDQLKAHELSARESLLLQQWFAPLVDELNDRIDQYNNKSMSFNSFYTTFPNSIFAKQSGLKRKLYFDIHFGKENKDPLEQIRERTKWQNEIEKQHDLQ